MTEPTEEEVLAGLLTITIAGRSRTIPTLSISDARPWRAKVAAAIGPIAAIQIAASDWEKLPGQLALAEDVLVELICAYDRTDVLGGREWVEGHGHPRELGTIFTTMLESVIPFDRAAIALGAAAAAAPPAPSSTSGPSPTGASIRALSKSDSTPGS